VSDKGLDPAEGKPNYNSLLFGMLIKISEDWNRGDPEGALNRTFKFTVFLPTVLKKRIKKQRDFIKEALRKAYQKQGVDFYTGHLVRNRAARRVAHSYLEPFLDEIIDWLDQRGYLEVKKRKVPTGSE